MIRRVIEYLFYKDDEWMTIDWPDRLAAIEEHSLSIIENERTRNEAFEKFKEKNNINNAVIVKHNKYNFLGDLVLAGIDFYTIDDYICYDNEIVNIFLFNDVYERIKFEKLIFCEDSFVLLDRYILKFRYDDALKFWFEKKSND